MKEQDKAVSCFRSALSSDPNHIEANCNLANVLREQRKPKIALKHYETVLRQEPEHSNALLGKAVCLCMMEEVQDPVSRRKYRKDATECLRQVVELGEHSEDIMEEIGRMQKMVASNATPDQISAQLGVIEGAVEDARARFNGLQASPPLPMAMPREKGGEVSREKGADISRKIVASSPRNSESASVTTSISTQSRSRKSPSKMPRSTSMASVLSAVPLTNKSYDRLCTWSPPMNVTEADISAEMVEYFDSLGCSIAFILSTYDLPLLQLLQPLTVLTLESLRHEFSHLKQSIASNRQLLALRMGIEVAVQVIVQLVSARSPPHLVEILENTLRTRIFAMMDRDGTGLVSIPVVFAVLALLVDAPPRERIETAYRFLMARSCFNDTGEAPVTRGDVIEFISTLKVCYFVHLKILI